MTRAPTPNDFAVLGLRPGAGDDEIRAAYRRLVKVHHPDRNPGDADALITFRRLTESYAALRSRDATLARPQSPLSTTRAGSRRAPQRRSCAGKPTALGDLAVGGALWVAEDAVLVGPDRSAALAPAAAGSAFPTPRCVIRAERRADGFHVFLPPQPAARWPVTAAAETDGLAVSALWVGDRQDHEPGHPHAGRVPLRLLAGTIGEMAADERGWASMEALAVDTDGVWSIDPAQPLSQEPHRATPVRVLRDADGFRVHSDIPAADWPPEEAAQDGSEPVLTAMLAGVTYPPAPSA
jgi:DnaJ domain